MFEYYSDSSNSVVLPPPLGRQKETLDHGNSLLTPPPYPD